MNIQLEKVYQEAKLLSVKCPVNLTSWTSTGYTSLRYEALGLRYCRKKFFILQFIYICWHLCWFRFLIFDFVSYLFKESDSIRFVWVDLFLLFENYLMNKELRYTEESCPILVGIPLLIFHYRVALFHKKATKRNLL